jgi:hypothetical protein
MQPFLDIPGDVQEEFVEGAKQAKKGLEDTDKKIAAHEMPGIGESFETFGGALREIFSPITGTAKALVGDPIRKAMPKGAAGEFTAKVGEDVATLAGPGALSKTLQMASKMLPSYDASVQKLMDSGVRLTPGQIWQGFAKTFKRGEDALSRSVPVVGDVMAHGQYKALEDFNRAIYNKALERVGQKLPDNVPMGPQAVAMTDRALGQMYDQILPHLTLRVDQQLATDLATISARRSDLQGNRIRTVVSIAHVWQGARPGAARVCPSGRTIAGQASRCPGAF